PTGVKWRTVAANCSDLEPTTVVVNAAEGEPGTFKDRTLLRFNPYEVIEGAVIAAIAVGGAGVVIATKARFHTEAARVRAGVGEVMMGTPLREVIDLVGGGPGPERQVKAVLTGVSNTVITDAQLDTPVSYEAFRAVGSWLGSGSFVVLDDEADMVSVAAGAS